MEKSYYAVFSIQKYNSTSAIRAQEKHNNREYPMHHVNDALSWQNRDLVSTGGLSYLERWHDLKVLASAKYGQEIKPRKNSVLALDIVTAMSPGAETELHINLDAWCDQNKAFMEDTFGTDNILVMTLHRDEMDEFVADKNKNKMLTRGTHIHTLIIPIDERGHLCARSFTGTKAMLRNLHTKYASYMEQFGLSRGEKHSKLPHTERNRWYNQTHRICNTQTPRIQDGETMEVYLERLDKEWQDMHLELENIKEKANKKISAIETREVQIFSDYAWAINLQHLLEERYEGDMTKVNQRLKDYQIIEKTVPRLKLDVLIHELKRLYPISKSIEMFRTAKKKKHKKWESLDTDTSSDNKSDGFINEIEEEPVEQTGKSVSLLDEENQRRYQERFLVEEQTDESTKEMENSLANPFGEKLGE